MPKMKLIADVNIKVLVVEDDMELASMIEHDLHKAGFEVVTVGRGIEARDVLQEEEFDLVICDWKLPDFGGLDLLGFVRQRYGIPFVLMTGFSDFIQSQDVYESGAAVFLSKPFNRTVLHSAVSQALGLEAAATVSLQEVLKRQ
ncbi:MAG: response regulator [Bdellovibrionia bacterium]